MGWPVEWLKQMISNDEFDMWCKYHELFPIDDQSNYHVPLAALHASFINVNRAEGARPVTLADCLVFSKKEDKHIDDILINEEW